MPDQVSYVSEPASADEVSDVRRSFETKSRLVNQFLTIWTGAALPGEQRLVKIGPLSAWFTSTLTLLIAAALNFVVIGAFAYANIAVWPLLAAAYVALTLVVVGRVRAQQVIYAHYAVHGAMAVGKAWINRLVASISVAIALGQNPSDYADEHVKGHHRTKTFTTLADGDANFLDRAGFRPGMTKAELWKTLGRTLISPRFHAEFAWARVKSALITSGWRHRSVVLVWLALLALVGWIVGPLGFVLGILLPWGPLYHVSALLQFLTEHRWQVTRAGPSNDQDYADRCAGRFCGERAPPRTLQGAQAALAWTGWAARMVFVHAPVRVAVLVGDLPAHDAHHLVGRLKRDPRLWRDAIFEREAAIQSGDPLNMRAREFWGLCAMIEWVFEGYEHAEQD